MTLTKIVDGQVVELTPDEEAAVLAEWAANAAAQQQTAWMGQREAAYGSIASQLDYIYHNGLDAWSQMVYEVKQQYPKPDGSTPSTPTSKLLNV